MRGACCTIQSWLYPLQPANNDSSVRENSKNRAGAPSQTKSPDLWSVPRSLLPLIPCLSVLRSFLWHSTDVIQKHPREQLHSETVLSSSLSPLLVFFSLTLYLSQSLSSPFLSPVACEAVAGRELWGAETIRAFLFSKMGYHFKSPLPSTSVSCLKSFRRLGRGQIKNSNSLGMRLQTCV